MTARVWPVAAVAGAPAYDGRSLRQTSVAVPLAGATAARPFAARSGVRPNTSTSTVTATSTTWTVGEHAGVIDAESAAEAGPYEYSFDANVTGSMTAASASYARIDLISVQISDPAESDGSSTPSAAIVYTPGTAAAPALPTQPARSMVIAQINVPISGGGSPSVTWVAPYLTGPGGTIPVRSAAERDAAAAYGNSDAAVWIDYAGTLYRGVSGTATPVAVVPGYGEATGPGAGISVPTATQTALGAQTVGTNYGSLLTASGSGVTVNKTGVYAIHQFVQFALQVTGRCFVQIQVNGQTRARVACSGEDIASATIPAIQVSAGQLIASQVYQSTGSAVTCNSQVYVNLVRPL